MKTTNMSSKQWTHVAVLALHSITFFLLLIGQIFAVADGRSVADSNGAHKHNQLVSNLHQDSKLTHTQAVYQNRCESGWIWYNNKCWVADHTRRDFQGAMKHCKQTYNSTLPTIHSYEENQFFRQSIEYLQNSPVWLYARHNHQYNKTRWLDKSPVNFTNWDVDQPSEKSNLICVFTEDTWYLKKGQPGQNEGQTECVTFWDDTKWSTQVGCLVLLPVVCEKKLLPVSRLYEGPNGPIGSQYEQQQMSSLSGAQTLFGQYSSSSLMAITSVSTTILLLLMWLESSFYSTKSNRAINSCVK